MLTWGNFPNTFSPYQPNTAKRESGMNIDSMTIGEAKQLAAMFAGQQAGPREIPGNGRYVIVRSRDAGVQFGKLDRYGAIKPGMAAEMPIPYTARGTQYERDQRR